MSLGTNNLTAEQIATELGITLGNNRDVADLTRYASMNKHSFRRPGGISANASTKLIKYDPFTANDLGGDFREYNHTSSAPVTEDDYTHLWGPGGANTTLTFTITPNQVNTKELGGDYYTFKLYSSSANRASKTSPVKTYTVAITYSTVTAPSGHTNNQTNKPTSPQIITITNVTTTYAVLYMDSFVSNSGGTEIARFADSHTDITMTENVVPYMKATKSIPSADLPAGNSPGGYPWTATGSRFQIYTASTPKCAASIVDQSTGTSYSFYWTVILMDTNTDQYAAGVSDITLRAYNDDGSQSDDQEIEANTSNTDPTTQRSESGTLSVSMAYNEDWEVYYDDSNSSGNITYNGSYSAC
jgi:hypothetical protein